MSAYDDRWPTRPTEVGLVLYRQACSRLLCCSVFAEFSVNLKPALVFRTGVTGLSILRVHECKGLRGKLGLWPFVGLSCQSRPSDFICARVYIHAVWNKYTHDVDSEHIYNTRVTTWVEQESSAVADKPARRESMPKIAPIRRGYNVVAYNTIILVYHHSFSCCCIRNLRNSDKFSENSNI